jgi:hypothetical protein
MENTIKEDVALRRAALFNIKVRNMGIRDILKHDYKRERELIEERDKLVVILKTSTKVENVDELLLNPKQRKEEKNENKNNHKY